MPRRGSKSPVTQHSCRRKGSFSLGSGVGLVDERAARGGCSHPVTGAGAARLPKLWLAPGEVRRGDDDSTGRLQDRSPVSSYFSSR